MGRHDERHPLDADRFVEGFDETTIVHHVDPSSELGRAMAEARASWGEDGPPGPEAFDWSAVRPEPVTE